MRLTYACMYVYIYTAASYIYIYIYIYISDPLVGYQPVYFLYIYIQPILHACHMYIYTYIRTWRRIEHGFAFALCMHVYVHICSGSSGLELINCVMVFDPSLANTPWWEDVPLHYMLRLGSLRSCLHIYIYIYIYIYIFNPQLYVSAYIYIYRQMVASILRIPYTSVYISKHWEAIIYYIYNCLSFHSQDKPKTNYIYICIYIYIHDLRGSKMEPLGAHQDAHRSSTASSWELRRSPTSPQRPH